LKDLEISLNGENALEKVELDEEENTLELNVLRKLEEELVEAKEVQETSTDLDEIGEQIGILQEYYDDNYL